MSQPHFSLPLELSQFSRSRNSKAFYDRYRPLEKANSNFKKAMSYIEGGEAYLSELENGIEKRTIYAVEFLNKNCVVGYAVFRIDTFGSDLHLVVLHCVSEYHSFMACIEEYVYALARGCKANKIRIHADRKSMIKILKSKFAFEFFETVLIKETPNVQILS